MGKGQDRSRPGAYTPSTTSTLHLGNKLGLQLGSYSQGTCRKREDAQEPAELPGSQVDKVRTTLLPLHSAGKRGAKCPAWQGRG